MKKPQVDLTKTPTKVQIRERLEWVKIQITAYPAKYAQWTFCGTACCIGGQLDILARGVKAHAAAFAYDDQRVVTDTACAAIGVRLSVWLFSSYFFSGPALIREEALDSDPVTPQLACKAIDVYLEEIGA